MCPKYLCILLYVKLIQCSGTIDLWSNGGGGLGICAFHYMLNLFGVVVFHRSMVDWRGYMCPRYMCILLYVKRIHCSGIPYIYGQLEEGAWYMCIVLYVKLIWCSGIPYIYGQLEGGTSAQSICILLYVKLIQCHGIP